MIEELSQLFENNFDCYADADNPETMAMTKEKFISVVSNRLEKHVRQGDSQPVQTVGLNPKALEIVGKYGLDCPDCDNEGYYWQGQDDPEMIQCQFCYVEAKSKYNLKEDLRELIGGLSA